MNDNDKAYVIENKIAYSVSEDNNKSEYSIDLRRQKINIPFAIENEIKKGWESYVKNKTNYAESNILYLSGHRPQCDIAFLEKYRYALLFGSNKYSNKYPCLAASNNLIALKSVCILQTSDNILVIGIKDKESKETVHFSNYIYENFVKEHEVDMHGHLMAIISDYFSFEKSCIYSIKKTGQSYSEINNSICEENIERTFNNNFIIKLNITFDALIKKLKCNYSKKSILKIILNSDSINQCIDTSTSNISIDCIAAIYNSLIYSNKVSKAIQVNKAYKKNLRVRVDTKNESGYTYDILKNLRIYKWGLIGNSKIKRYSIAPAMWIKLFEYLNYPVNYFIINEDDEVMLVKQIKKVINDLGFIGCNVAMPWKGIAFEQCDSISSIVNEFKTVNTLTKSDGIIKGYNTDGLGLVNSIKQVTSIFGKNVLVMGAGGACQTLPHHLLKNKVSSVYVCDIIANKAYSLEEKYNNAYRSENKTICAVRHSEISKIINKVDIFINATPCGMIGYHDEIALSKTLVYNLKSNAVIAEMVYNPYRTLLLDMVQGKHLVCEGINMLVEQAAVSFCHSFGIELTNETKALMKEFALVELKKRYSMIA